MAVPATPPRKTKNTPLLTGSLYKESDHVKQWNLRYFVLEDNRLLMYTDAQSVNDRPRAMIQLEGCELSDILSDGDKHIFRLCLPNAGRTFVLAASQLELAQQWRAALARTSRVEYSLEKIQQMEKAEFEERFTRLPPAAKLIYQASQDSDRGWSLVDADQNGVRIWRPTSPDMPATFVRSFGLSVVGVYMMMGCLHFISQSRHSDVLVMTALVLSAFSFWTKITDTQLRQRSVLYCGILVIAINVLVPPFSLVPLSSVVLGVFVITLWDQDSTQYLVNVLVHLNRVRYKASFRIEQTPEILLRMLTSYEQRKHWDMNLERARLVHRFSRSKTVGHLAYRSSLPALIRDRDLCLEQEWFYTGLSTYIVTEQSVLNVKCPLNPLAVRAHFFGGLVISQLNKNPLATTTEGGPAPSSKEKRASLVTIVGELDVRGPPFLNFLVSRLVPMREAKSVFAVDGYVKVAPPRVLQDIAQEFDCDDDEEEQASDKEAVNNRRETIRAVASTAFTELVQLNAAPGWEVVMEQDGVTVSKKPSTGSMPIVRGCGTLPIPAYAILDLLLDLSKKHLIDSMFDTGRVVEEIDPFTRVDYQAFKAVFPTTARDFCNMASWKFDKETNTIIIAAKSVLHPDCPEDPNHVRGEVHVAGYLLQLLEDKKSTRVTFIANSDLKGSLPSSLVAKVSIKQPLIVANIRKYFSTVDISRIDIAKYVEMSAGFSEGAAPANMAPAKEKEVGEVKEEKKEQLPMMVPGDANKYLDIADKALDSLLELVHLPEDSWEFLNETDDVRISSRSIKGSACKMFRGLGIVHANPVDIMAIIADPARRKWYDDMCVESSRFMELDSSTSLIYQTFEARDWCRTAARDFVMVTKWTRLQDGTCVVVGKSVTHPDYPEGKKRVRATAHLGGWVIKPSQKVSSRSLVFYFMQVDLGGSVPSWAANIVSKKQPLCINHIRKLFSS
eukprot:TRINITY_DN5912_c0_g1_i1.p1 TRINITY_DN5912_c0_g1~~TRINITY_DN5912_c0_g1_i1.p1  ORF type:complete len:954 (-),score=260.10 TRINITY_DN5912_c0_g1_i1:40-2901(-)